MKPPRPATFVTVVAVIVLVIGAVGALLLPRILDSQMIRDRINATLPKGFEKNLIVGKIALVWFPRPNLVLENAELSFGDHYQSSIRAIRIYPSVVYLLIGRLVVRRAVLLEPSLKIRLPEPPVKPFELEDLEKEIASGLIRLTRELAAAHLDLSGGSAEISIAGKPPVVLQDVSAQTAASLADLRFELSARSNLWEGLRAEGSISPEKLSAQLRIGVQRLKLKESFIFLPLQFPEYMRQGDASFDAKVASVGLRQVKASIGGFAEPLVFARDGGAATLEIRRFKGAVTYEDGAFRIDVEQLDLASPRLKASGQIRSEADSLSAHIKAGDVDIAELGGLALRIVDDAEDVKKILRYVPAGTIPELSLQTSGRSFTDLMSSKNLVLSGRLRNGRIFIPGPDLELENVIAAVRVAGNNLHAENISANLRAMRGRNGVLSFGLQGRTAPFHLDVLVHTEAPEVLSVLLKVVRDQAVRAELLKVRRAQGELSGRLILGETADALSPVVAISNADFSAEYEPIPFPISIRAGRLSYDPKIVSIENAQGAVGGSRFGELGLILHRDGTHQIKIVAKRALLDLRQADTLLRSLKAWRSDFGKLMFVRGRIELENLTLAGPYDDPSR